MAETKKTTTKTTGSLFSEEEVTKNAETEKEKESKPVKAEKAVKSQPVKEEEIKTRDGVIVNALDVNVRKSADYKDNIIGCLCRNAFVTINIDKSTDEFYKITSPVEGYVNKKFVKEL